jgi:hypothetical protein
VVAATFGLAGTASAEEFTCRGTVVGMTLDNVSVPDGKRCILKRSFVKGTVKVETNARLRAVRVRVIGNVQGENAYRVAVLRRSRIGGSVQVVQSRFAKVKRSRVNADILFDENSGFQAVIRNRVGGNVQVFQNRRGIRIYGNRIIGNLQCKENTRRPRGGRNIVHGSKEDQCARL